MKNFIKKIDKVLSIELPWWFFCLLGAFLMIVPTCFAVSKGISSFEPGFSHGFLYGLGSFLSFDGFFRSFEKKKKASDQEKTGH